MQTTITTCQRCGGENPSDAQYCIECGEALTLAIGPTTKLATAICPSCGSGNPLDASFCAICGRSMPEASTVGQAWAAPQSVPQARLRPQPASVPTPTPLAPPLVVAPPAPPSTVPHSYPRPMAARRHYRPAHRHGFSPAAIVLILGLIGLSVMKLMSLPFLLLVGGAAFLVYQAEHGRFIQSLRMVIMAVAGWFVITNPRMWPILIAAFLLIKLLGGNRRIW